MFSVDKYKSLASKYGSYSSWAIWDHTNSADTTIIDQHYQELHSRFVLLGLNISRYLSKKSWSNFHGKSHDRKLRYACNDSKLCGSYITDIFKGIAEANSKKFEQKLTNQIIKNNVNFFKQEMRDIGVNDKTQFIVLGMPTSLLARCFNRYFKESNNIIYYCHYSYFTLTDKEWVEGFWRKLGIDQDFDLTAEKYKMKK